MRDGVAVAYLRFCRSAMPSVGARQLGSLWTSWGHMAGTLSHTTSPILVLAPNAHVPICHANSTQDVICSQACLDVVQKRAYRSVTSACAHMSNSGMKKRKTIHAYGFFHH